MRAVVELVFDGTQMARPPAGADVTTDVSTIGSVAQLPTVAVGAYQSRPRTLRFPANAPRDSAFLPSDGPLAPVELIP